ncbi:NtaA/DmoA family FMN-dependent monooxygenase [Salipiger pentaromativorans]|uniref:NtaA/DmoA family FMN-dependent monooxygenase n=1 Tax=Salipiger pentaromativorans TaxID=2943193 RepID=UPI002157361A|nr:NtaA/DmoA family FMN-dependent monooxygenase [Salipiger pentaromativorans]
MTTSREMHLIAYLKTGPTANHMGAWRHPEADLQNVLTPGYYEHLARVLENGRFDGCFFADGLGLHDIYNGGYQTRLQLGGQISFLDPMMVLPLMARATTHLGICTTLSTTFHQPYNLARMLSSLDILSGGRVAWNIVTSTRREEALNFGMDDLPTRDERYDRADEVVEACCALWDCWEEGSLVMDKENGLMVDASKVHYANYEGRWTKTRGPLTIPRSPQGRPVLMQAGSSPRGRDFAARWAEVIFVPLNDKAELRAFREDIAARMSAVGRDPAKCAILPSLRVVVGETESIAEEKAAYLDSLIDPELVIAARSSEIGVDLAQPMKDIDAIGKARGTQGMHESFARVQRLMEQENIGFEDALRRQSRRGTLVGTAQSIVDQMQDLFDGEACDGFIIEQMVVPSSLEEFCRTIVPELQKRGLLRREYRGTTLRENLQ